MSHAAAAASPARSPGEKYYFRSVASVLAEGFSLFVADANPPSEVTEVQLKPFPPTARAAAGADCFDRPDALPITSAR